MSNCPKCDKDIYYHPGTKYCMHCGYNLKTNICTNSKCYMHTSKTQLPEDAIYCPICGKHTTLHPPEDTSDLPF